jgi:hypothetical protein
MAGVNKWVEGGFTLQSILMIWRTSSTSPRFISTLAS